MRRERDVIGETRDGDAIALFRLHRFGYSFAYTGQRSNTARQKAHAKLPIVAPRQQGNRTKENWSEAMAFFFSLSRMKIFISLARFIPSTHTNIVMNYLSARRSLMLPAETRLSSGCTENQITMGRKCTMNLKPVRQIQCHLLCLVQRSQPRRFHFMRNRLVSRRPSSTMCALRCRTAKLRPTKGTSDILRKCKQSQRSHRSPSAPENKRTLYVALGANRRPAETDELGEVGEERDGETMELTIEGRDSH